MGLGTLIIGAYMIIAGLLQTIISDKSSEWIMAGGILVGLALMLYAQMKYNKGMF